MAEENDRESGILGEKIELIEEHIERLLREAHRNKLEKEDAINYVVRNIMYNRDFGLINDSYFGDIIKTRQGQAEIAGAIRDEVKAEIERRKKELLLFEAREIKI